MASRILLSSLFVAVALAACGGGGDGGAALVPGPGGAGAPAATDTPAPASSPSQGTDPGAVSALFQKSAGAVAVRLDGLGGFSGGALDTYTQVPSGGAVTSINGVALGVPATVMDIHGDETYALGRWFAGAVTGASGGFTLSPSGSNAFHYVLFNKPASLPTSGALVCDAGTFTTPTYLGGTAVSQSQWQGHVTGSAQVSFSGAGAAVKLNIVVSNSASAGSNDYSTTVAQGTAVSFAGHSFGSGQPNAWIGVGQALSGYDVTGGYVAATANGATYTGVYRFHCH